MERSKVLIWSLAALALLVFGCLSACLGTAFYCGKTSLDAKQSAEAAAKAFVDALREGPSADAYALTTEALRRRVTRSEFDALVAKSRVRSFPAVTLRLSSISVLYGAESTAEVEVSAGPGATVEDVPFVLVLKGDGHAWRADELRLAPPVRFAPPSAASRDAGSRD